MFFGSINGINRLIINRMSNIYLKVSIEKKLTFSKLPSLKNLSRGQFLESSKSNRYHRISKLLAAI